MVMDALNNILICAAILIVVFLLAMVPYAMGRNTGYREGQIDALNGKLYYKLEKQADSEFRWVECQGVCTYEKEKPR